MKPDGSEYDTSKIDMEHTGMPEHFWHPAALLRVVAEGCSVSPYIQTRRYSSALQREVSVTSAAARLGERGFDVDELVRSVFQGSFVGELKRLSLRVAFDISLTGEASAPVELRPLGKWALKHVDAPEPGDSFSTYLRRAIYNKELESLGRRVAGWIQVADLADLLTWNLPVPLEFDSFAEADVGSRECESRWLADRFLLTYVDAWNTSSLHDEFRWASGLGEAPLDRNAMLLRLVPQDRLNAEISQRAVMGDLRDPRSLLMSGVQYLREGEQEKAVALFQGALTVADSQWVRNCLAFALVPSDPAGSERMFRELLAEGFDPPLVHANLAAVKRVLGDIGLAQEHALEGLALLASGTSREAFLWGFVEGSPSLMSARVEEYLRFVLGWGPS